MPQLERWLAEVRADDERLRRRREQWLLVEQQESATLVGALTDLADAGAVVVAETGGGRHTGVIVGVGLDVVFLRDQKRWVLVPLSNLLAVRAVERVRPTTGDRPAPLDTTFAEALLELLAERNRVVATLTSGERLSGRLVSVGEDAVTIELDGERRATAVARLTGVADVVVA